MRHHEAIKCPATACEIVAACHVLHAYAFGASAALLRRFTVLLRLGACRVAATSLAALQCVLHCIIWVAVRVSWANWWVTWVPPTNGDKSVGFHPLMGINPC